MGDPALELLHGCDLRRFDLPGVELLVYVVSAQTAPVGVCRHGAGSAELLFFPVGNHMDTVSSLYGHLEENFDVSICPGSVFMFVVLRMRIS